MTDQELNSFLSEYSLEACGPQETLKDRAARLKIAMDSKGFICSELPSSQKTRLLQALLEVADVFCIRKEDLQQPALAPPMTIDTGDAPPIKRKPYRVGSKER